MLPSRQQTTRRPSPARAPCVCTPLRIPGALADPHVSPRQLQQAEARTSVPTAAALHSKRRDTKKTIKIGQIFPGRGGDQRRTATLQLVNGPCVRSLAFPQYPSPLPGTLHSPPLPDPEREGSCPEGRLGTGRPSRRELPAFPRKIQSPKQPVPRDAGSTNSVSRQKTPHPGNDTHQDIPVQKSPDRWGEKTTQTQTTKVFTTAQEFSMTDRPPFALFWHCQG